MGNVMKAVDLHRVLTSASVFAGNDLTLPMLNAVRLEFREDSVVAAATDRFVLGVARADYAGEAFTGLVALSDVKTLLRMTKTATGAVSWREAEISPEYGPGEDGRVVSLSVRFTTGEALTIQLMDVDFPKFAQLIPEDDTTFLSDPAAVKGFNAGYLAKFAKVEGSHVMRLHVGAANKPAVVTIGNDFIGLIMPVRLPDSPRYVRPTWL